VIAGRTNNIGASPAMDIMDRIRVLTSTGSDIINLSGGEPDFNAPEPVRAALVAALNAGRTHYAPARGLTPLRRAIADKLNSKNCIDCDEGNILVTPGAKYAIFEAVMTLINEGDEVLILEPAWVSYSAMVRMAGGVPVPVRLDYEQNYAITKEALLSFVTEKTKLIIINTPCNPTGRVLNADEAEAVRDVVLSRGLYVIADEVYEKLIYDGRKHISLASYGDVADRVVTVNGFSKFAAMTGFRVGWLCASDEIVSSCFKLHQHSVTCLPEFVQEAALAALDCKDEVNAMYAAYERRRQMFCLELAPLNPMLPEGAFYLWLKFRGQDGSRLCGRLLDAGVGAVPGSAFGASCTDCVRLCFAKDEGLLSIAAKRILTVLR